MGVKILGQYDFVNILEAPNNVTIPKVAVELGSRGTLQTLTMAALPVDNFIGSMKKKRASRKGRAKK